MRNPNSLDGSTMAKSRRQMEEDVEQSLAKFDELEDHARMLEDNARAMKEESRERASAFEAGLLNFLKEKGIEVDTFDRLLGIEHGADRVKVVRQTLRELRSKTITRKLPEFANVYLNEFRKKLLEHGVPADSDKDLATAMAESAALRVLLNRDSDHARVGVKVDMGVRPFEALPMSDTIALKAKNIATMEPAQKKRSLTQPEVNELVSKFLSINLEQAETFTSNEIAKGIGLNPKSTSMVRKSPAWKCMQKIKKSKAAEDCDPSNSSDDELQRLANDD